MIMDTSMKSYFDALHNINKAARTRSIQQHPPRKITDQCDIADIPKLSLPPPQDITQSLMKLGCPSSATAKQLSDTYMKLARAVHSRYELTHQKTCNKLAHQLISDPGIMPSFKQVISIVERKYQDEIFAIEQRAVRRMRELQSQIKVSKPTFNHEFVPFLEKYFEYNAYPSAPDRASLARKSAMTLRQIEVWFQNHRNRAKKEGIKLQRLTPGTLPLELSLKPFQKSMPPFIIPEQARENHWDSYLSEDSESDDEVPLVHSSLHTFSTITPPHAFPTPYSISSHQPFLTDINAFVFPAPVWTRQKTNIPASTRPNVTIDEIIAEFATKLTIKDEAKPSTPANSLLNTSAKRPWFTATHTTLSSAPHPAFIPALSSPASATLLTPVPITLTADSFLCTTAWKEYTCLPKRTHRHRSPILDRTGISPSLIPRSTTPPRSRTSSYGSNGSPSRRSCSPSGYSSNTSSALATPVLPATSLPENIPSISVVESQNYDDLLGDFQITRSLLDEITPTFPHVEALVHQQYFSKKTTPSPPSSVTGYHSPESI